MIVKEKGSDFKPVPAGTHFGRAYGMVDLGTQPSNNPKFDPAHKLLLLWELPGETYEHDGEQVPCTISKEYTASIGKKANLRKHLDSWRGRAFTEDEAKGFEIANVIGVACTLSVSHQTKSDGGKYAKIESVSGLPKGVTVPPMWHEKVHYELEMGKNEVFQSLPEWMQKKINQCLEWNPSETQEPVAAPGAMTEADDGEDDSALPF